VPAEAATPPAPSVQLEFLINELHVQPPFYYRWIERHMGSNFSRSRMAQPLVRRTLQLEILNWQRRRNAAAQLAALGTNAWPVAPSLCKDVSRDVPTGVLAASVLARINADQHPQWHALVQPWQSRTTPVVVFRHLLTGRDEFARPYEAAHRRFALLGLTAVRTAAAPAIPDLLDLLHSEPSHELWPLAVTPLEQAGAPADQYIPLLRDYLLDDTRYPTQRASAALALAAIVPPSRETLDALYRVFNHDFGILRVAAARALWRLNEPVAPLLPTLQELLKHRLRTVRRAVLELIAEIGPPALPCLESVNQRLSDDSEQVRDAAGKAMWRLGIVPPAIAR
jgi:hypothetical protein